jgi:mono/diheme cytochrome c family protein
MEKVYQFSSLQMGWCIDCHRGDTPLSPAEQESVEKRSSYVRKLAALEAAGHDVEANKKRWPKQRASTDCVVCHY